MGKNFKIEPFKPGMEDGVICYEVETGKEIGYFARGTPQPRSTRKPAIMTSTGPKLVKHTDFIVLYDDGSKDVKQECGECIKAE